MDRVANTDPAWQVRIVRVLRQGWKHSAVTAVAVALHSLKQV